MKMFVITLVFFVAFLNVAIAQEHTPQLLKEPASWQFERFALPPTFAPSIPYRGVEELRFAPGMFSKDSVDYFTYVFVAEIDSVISISQKDIQDYLLKYYKGLCGVTASDRKLLIDTSQIKAVVTKREKAPGKDIVYDAIVNLFGVFADGAPVTLNLEINLIANTTSKKTYLFFIASPGKKSEAIWTRLIKIRRDVIASGTLY